MNKTSKYEYIEDIKSLEQRLFHSFFYEEANEERKEILKDYDITTISGYHYQYQFMRDSFPDQNVLIWYIGDNKKVQEEYIQLANQDDKVKVLLIAEEIPENKK